MEVVGANLLVVRDAAAAAAAAAENTVVVGIGTVVVVVVAVVARTAGTAVAAGGSVVVVGETDVAAVASVVDTAELRSNLHLRRSSTVAVKVGKEEHHKMEKMMRQKQSASHHLDHVPMQTTRGVACRNQSASFH